ncbi:unnamed protein product [Vicia faba]|uniref:Uncharacterized protein n=1 Tax=Vicia faba TaxID=3906 RepID=A0AAV0YLY9_VICFA|nr:unnamed protein product [Vicia faba]
METVGGQKERAGFRSIARTEGGRDPLAVQADSSVAASGDACSAARLRCVGGQKFGGGAVAVNAVARVETSDAAVIDEIRLIRGRFEFSVLDMISFSSNLALFNLLSVVDLLKGCVMQVNCFSRNQEQPKPQFE